MRSIHSRHSRTRSRHCKPAHTLRKERKSKLDQGLIRHPDADVKACHCLSERTRHASASPSCIKAEMRKTGSRRFRRLGVGQHTFEKALRSTVKPPHVQKI